ncbi:MAG: glycosyltransferase, partial [Spirochaetales bacterium]|nr:glycosyltransferase [Spirochaetales bacterium]
MGIIIIYTILVLLGVLDILVLCATWYTKKASVRRFIKRSRLKDLVSRSLVEEYLVDLDSVDPSEHLDYLMEWYELNQTIRIPPHLSLELQALEDLWNSDRIVRTLLSSRSFMRRSKGVNLLDFLDFGDMHDKIELLQKTIGREKSQILRLKMVHILCQTGDPENLNVVAASMEGAEELYKRKVLSLVNEDLQQLTEWADTNRHIESSDGRRIIIQACRTRLREWYSSFLLEIAASDDVPAASEAARVLLEIYHDESILRELLQSNSLEIRKEAVFHLFHYSELPTEEETALFFRDSLLSLTAVSGLIERVRESPRFLPVLFERYQNSQESRVRLGYASVLAPRIQYFIMRLKKDETGIVGKLLDDVISLELSSPIINFLNSNRNQTLERLLIEALTPHVRSKEHFFNQCHAYLKDSLKKKLNIPLELETSSEPKIQLTRRDRYYMAALLAGTLAVPFLLFFITRWSQLPYMTGEEKLVSFLLMYHHLFAVYTIAINSIFLALLVESWTVLNRQHSAWSVADKKFLNAPGLLPEVTILAPAYNEEKTIIQNVYSLLSLDYPNLQLIVINDESSDGTLGKLINHFDMELSDFPLSDEISTAPVKGVYRNSRIPNLLVIDKKNGGKADSLNAGLNAAKSEYVCSIDADSLLEPESLTKMMFQSLINKNETIAVGGNVIPVNGCLVKNGGIQEIHLSSNSYSRFQTIEYLRSFIAGRLGWTRINSLLIISGAFGAFLRRDVIGIGGYMTGKGRLTRDTVGEDMELVVRLVRSRHERGEDYNVSYAHNANCWTEVPETLGDLL